jgi:hypothetical protein
MEWVSTRNPAAMSTEFLLDWSIGVTWPVAVRQHPMENGRKLVNDVGPFGADEIANTPRIAIWET